MMPMMPSQGAMGGGMPEGLMACPCCGRPMPMPDASMDAPNPQIPPELLGLGQNGQPQDSGLLQALTGGYPG